MSKRTILKRSKPEPYVPIPHVEWTPGELLVNVRSGKLAVAQARKVAPDDEPFPGWWVEDTTGFPMGGVADFVDDWRSLECVLAERRHLGL